MTLRWWQVCTGDTRWRGDNEGLWHSHHLLTCTDDVLMTCQWSVCNSLCAIANVAGYQSVGEENTYELKNVTREGIFSSHVELWESLFLCDILRSRCSEYVTFHVDCTGVHTACTPSVHAYTPSRTIHSVVRRPQRGPHRWSSLRENKWNNEITVLSQLTGLITVKIRNLNVWSWDVTSTRVKWRDRLDSDMCQHLTNIIS